MFGDIARSHAAGKVRFLPLHYSAIFAYLAALPVDLALIQVTPPDADGQCSLGPSVHFVPAVLDRAARVVAEVNAAMPRPAQSVLVPYERLDVVALTDHPLVALETGALSDQARRIGQHVAGLIEDGDCIQVGIGKVPASILGALHGHRDLGLHGGMVTDEVVDLHAAARHGARNPGHGLLHGAGLARLRLDRDPRRPALCAGQLHPRRAGDGADRPLRRDQRRCSRSTCSARPMSRCWAAARSAARAG